MRVPVLVFCGAILAACQSTNQVMPLGPDTYSVSARVHYLSGGGPAATQKALAQANQHCAASNKQILVTNQSSQDGEPFGNAQVTFRCLAAGDPGLVRPTYEQSPNVVVRHR